MCTKHILLERSKSTEKLTFYSLNLHLVSMVVKFQSFSFCFYLRITYNNKRTLTTFLFYNLCFNSIFICRILNIQVRIIRNEHRQVGERAIKVMELVPPNVAYNYSTKYVQTRYTGSFKICELRIIYLLDIFICHKQSCFLYCGQFRRQRQYDQSNSKGSN